MDHTPEQPVETPLTVTTPERRESVPGPLLEERVQRLEDAVALLTHHVHWEELEEVPGQEPPVRRIGHLADEAKGPAMQVAVDPLPDPLLPREAEKPTPRAIPIPPPPTASLAEFTLPPFAEPTENRASAIRSMLKPIQSALPVASSVVSKVLPPSSLFRDLWWDIRISWRMLRDPYYPMTTACKVVPLFAVFYVTIWPMLSSWSGVIGTVMNYFVNAIVIYIAFKVIQLELRRYYEFAERYRR